MTSERQQSLHRNRHPKTGLVWRKALRSNVVTSISGAAHHRVYILHDSHVRNLISVADVACAIMRTCHQGSPSPLIANLLVVQQLQTKSRECGNAKRLPPGGVGRRARAAKTAGSIMHASIVGII